MAETGEIPLDTFITHTMGLEDINKAFDLMHEGKSIRSVIHFSASRAMPELRLAAGRTMNLENISCQKSFGGWHKRYRHRSEVLGCDMVFAVYLPPQAEQGGKLPVLYWLSGLTCTDENFMQKAGAMRMAAELGLIIVAPDTSPRGADVPGDPDGAWDFGLGAGFYLNARRNPGRALSDA
jgi:hypothetical protein